MNALLLISGIVIASLILALVGHLLWIFYRFLFRAFIQLIARSRGQEEADLPALNFRFFTYLFSAEGLRYWAYLGGVMVAVAAILLIKDYIAALLLIKYVQLAGIALVTGLTYIGGWKLSASPKHRTLGAALMLIGGILLPVNFWYYQKYILMVDRHQAYLVGFICTVVYLFSAIMRSNALFSYIAPLSFHVSTLLILKKLDYELEIYVFVSALLAVLYPIAADYLEEKWRSRFKSPLLVAAVGGLLFAAIAFLNLGRLENVYLPVYLFVAAALILNKIAQLKLDPRYLFLGLPIVAIIYLRHLEAFDLAHYWFGLFFSSLALVALGIWWIFFTRFPESSYTFYFQLLPLTLLMFSLPVDITSYLYLADKLGSLQQFRHLYSTAGLSVDALGNTWQGIHIAIYYLSYFSVVSLVIFASTGLTFISSAIIASKDRSTPVAFYSLSALFCCFSVGLIRFRHPMLFLDTYFLWYLGLSLVFAGCLWALRQKTKGEGQRAEEPFSFTFYLSPFASGLYAYAIISFLLTYVLAGVYFEMELDDNFDYYLCTLSLLGVIMLYLARNLPRDSFLRKLHVAAAVMVIGPLMLSSFIDWTSATFFMALTFLAGLIFLIYGWYTEEKAYLAVGSLSLLTEAVYAFLTVETGQVLIKVILLLLGVMLIFIGVYLKKGQTLRLLLLSLLLFVPADFGTHAADAAKNAWQDDPQVHYLVDLIRGNPDDQLIRARLARYIKQHYKNWENLPLPELPPLTVPDRFRRSFLRDDLASITGIRAIEGTLQLDAMRQQVIRDEEATIDISSLEALRIASHDYLEMLKTQRKNGNSPDISDVEHIIPADKIYLHFSDAKSFLQFLTVLDTYLAPALNMLTTSLTLEDVAAFFERTFALSFEELTQAAPYFQGIAIVVGDPSIHLGSDITLIFETEDNTAASKLEALLSSEKRRFLKTFRRFVVISNSEKALGQAGDIDHPLADAPDFLYIKSLRIPAENGFIYFSEAFVEGLISPQFRIKDLRRHNCRLNLLNLRHAAMLYAADGNSPESVTIENLIREKYLDSTPADLYENSDTPEIGMYQFDPATEEWRHALYGKLGNFTPLRELPIRKIRPVEESIYERFRSQYQRYFTRFIDPVGIGLSYGKHGLTLRTVILPLIDDPLYESIMHTLGSDIQEEGAQDARTPGQSRIANTIPSNYGISLLLRSPALKDILKKHWWWGRYSYYQREMQPYLENRNIFGPELFLGIGDVSFGNRVPATLKEFARLPFEIPAVMAQSLTDEEQGKEYVRRLFHQTPSTSVNGVPLHAFNVLGNINLYGSVYNNLLIMSSSLTRQKDLLGQASAKNQALLAESLQEQFYHLTAILQTAYLQQFKPHLFRMIQDQLGLSCRRSLATLQNLLDLYVTRYGSVLKDDDIHSLVSFGKVSKTPLCPEGGQYYISAGTQVVCSLHGSLETYQEQANITSDFFLNPFFTNLQRLIAQLRFTQEGIETKVKIEVSPLQ